MQSVPERNHASILTPAGADARVAYLRSGQSFIYYIGYLAVDRFPGGRSGGGLMRTREAARLGDRMLQHGSKGMIDREDGTLMMAGLASGSLTQRRIGNGIYEYRFTKR